MTGPDGLSREGRIEALKAAATERILVLDGAWGAQIQELRLDEEQFRGERLADHARPLRGNNDILCITRPQVITELTTAYLDAGADLISTNTFTSTSIAQADYGTEDLAHELNLAAARLARAAADSLHCRKPGEAALGRGFDRADQPHALDVGRRQRPGRAGGRLRRALRRLPRAGDRASRGWRRPLPCRDGVRHAQRQGGAQGDSRPPGRGPAPSCRSGSPGRSPTAPDGSCPGRRSTPSGSPCATPSRSPSGSTAPSGPSSCVRSWRNSHPPPTR